MAEKDPNKPSDSKKMESPRTKSPAGLFMTSTSPPSFVSFEELMKASTSVTNMALAHEIAIDADFKLQKIEAPKNSLEGRIRETMMTAFWDILREQLNSEPADYTNAINLLKEVREEIKGLLLPNQERLKNQIDEQLDLDLIKQQLEKKAFNLQSYATFIVEMMGKLCAPVRDEDIAHLRTLTDPVELYKEIFRVLELMKMDMANFTIAQMRPYIQQQSVIYEKKKFQEYLDTQTKLNIDGLQSTKLWLNKTYEKLNGTNAQSSNSTQISPNILLCNGYVSLLNWNADQEFPECVVMDEARFFVMGESLKRLVLVSTMILIAGSNYLTSPDPKVLKETIKSHTLAIIEETSSSQFTGKAENIAEQIVADIKQDCVQSDQKLASDKLKTMKQALILAVSHDHKVHKLLNDRLLEFILNTLLSHHREPIQLPQGLSSMHKELHQLIGQLMRIVAHNRNVFGSYYDDIIQNIITSRNTTN